ncbi:MAG: flagellar hook-length control protein FliK [Spirochaetaceae bacterium]|nr:flagellar hook-length control protein FliK [Spirochaetaceae bacterium]
MLLMNLTAEEAPKADNLLLGAPNLEAALTDTQPKGESFAQQLAKSLIPQGALAAAHQSEELSLGDFLIAENTDLFALFFERLTAAHLEQEAETLPAAQLEAIFTELVLEEAGAELAETLMANYSPFLSEIAASNSFNKFKELNDKQGELNFEEAHALKGGSGVKDNELGLAAAKELLPPQLADKAAQEVKLEFAPDDTADNFLPHFKSQTEAKPEAVNGPLNDFRPVNEPAGPAVNMNNDEAVIQVIDNRTAELPAAKEALPKEVIALRQALTESGNGEIVQRAQFILKAGDMGEIKLTLRPEELGVVRINLMLEDNKLIGRIVVDSAGAKAAFDDNMADLRDSFLKGGFAQAELSVALGGDRQNEHQTEQEQARPFFSERLRTNNIDGTGRYNSLGLNLRA